MPRMLSSSFLSQEAELVTAESLEPGDHLAFKKNDVNQKPVLARIEHIEGLELSHKNFLVTESGTVLANNLLASTICDDFGQLDIFNGTQGPMQAQLTKWQHDHAEVFSSWHQSIAVCEGIDDGLQWSE